MCGDDDNGASDIETRLFDAFLVHARLMLAEASRNKPDAGPVSAYADRLLGDALNRAKRDSEAADDEQRQSIFAIQPLVFARLAGFLASHLPAQDDPLRRVMEALLHGYSDAERLGAARGHDHGDGAEHRH